VKMPRLQSLFLPAAILTAGMFPACEHADRALQQEIAELRERADQAEAAAEAAKAEAGQLRRPDAAKMKSALEAATKKLARDVPGALPGYRPEAVKIGPIVYRIEGGGNPFRAPLEIRVRPSSPSALTPNLPPITVEAVADKDGNWQLPGPPELRELQAAASARAVAKADASRRENPPAPSHPAPQTAHPPANDPNARVITWGDQPATQQTPTQQPPPTTRPPTSSPNLPKADQSYEIRFD
jgi:hypothetical protein